MAARRGQGTGTIFQRADGMWVARVELPSDGRGRRRRQVARARKADAVTALRDLRRDLDRSGDLPTSSPTVETWARLWLTRVTPTLKPRTAATYTGYVERWIVPTIGRTRLDKLTAAHVYRVHDAMTGTGLSPTSALQAHRIMAKMLGDAEREGRVGRNVADLAVAPRRALAVRPALSAEQALALLAHLDATADPWLPHAAVALLAGLRQGERLGVTADTLDLDAGVLSVAWQVQRLPAATIVPPDQEATRLDGGLWLTRPKSRAGWREVPVVGILADVLRTHLEAHPPGMAGLVLHRGDGRPCDPSQDARAWRDALAGAGLPHVPLHSARHTCASLLAALGVREDIRMQILGHSSATVTRGYTHLTGAEARDGMASLSRLLDWRRAIEG